MLTLIDMNSHSLSECNSTYNINPNIKLDFTNFEYKTFLMLAD